MAFCKILISNLFLFLSEYIFYIKELFLKRYSLLFFLQVDVYKDPITDPGKTSKKGNITLVRNSKGEFETKNREEMTDNDTEALVEVFKNGVITREWTFEEIQERVVSFLFK